MERAGDNVTTKYLENPYFDGVISAITTQGEVTLNCRAEYGELKTRRINMSSNATRAMSYPGGDVIDNMHIMPHELVFGWIYRQGRNMIPGHPNQIGFTTMNGMKWGMYSTDEEMEQRIRFIGIAKTPFVFDNQYQLKHGFTAIGVGSGTTMHTGEVDIFPGDKIHWAVVPRPRQIAVGGPEQYATGARYGDSGPNSRFGNPRVGTPRGKIRFRINPTRFNDMRPSINAAVSAMKKPMARGGIADRPYEHLFNENSLGGKPKPTPNQELAMALYYTSMVSMVRGIEVLQKERGAIDLNTVDPVTLCDTIGVFNSSSATRSPIAEKLIDSWFMDISVNRNKSRIAYNDLKARVPSGFIRTGKVIKNNSTASRYVQIATNLGNIHLVGYLRAVHALARKNIGVALCYAKPGQRVDLLIGHFLENN